ncbi:glycoside hydrolase superfamily [Zopfochytrium polystomum]|nr:glycoside hydrolase superfamily [Zopfochytrium polystomum]
MPSSPPRHSPRPPQLGQALLAAAAGLVTVAAATTSTFALPSPAPNQDLAANEAASPIPPPSSSSAGPTIRLSRRFVDWNSGSNSKATWAFDCDWTGGDIASAPSTGENCGNLCLARDGCTHFTWTSQNGGICWMKTGDSLPLVFNKGASCGEVVAAGNARFAWAAGNEGRVSYATGCDWIAGDISSVSSKGEECGGLCLNQPGCVKFTWSPNNGGTCTMKDSAGATAFTASGTTCGIVASKPDISWSDAVSQAETLVSTLSLEQKVSLVSGTGWSNGPCVGNIDSMVHIGFQGLCLQDSPSGVRFASDVSVFPTAVNLAATFDKTLMYNQGLYMGREFRGKGVSVVLGPAMNIMRAPEGGRAWESGGADPVLSSFTASLQVKGMQSVGIIATAKHWILNDQEYSRETANSLVGARALREVYMRPFKACVDAGVGAVMCSYNSVNGTNACESSTYMSFLKDELGFQGFVMTDWVAVSTGNNAANAGTDMMMPGGNGYSKTDPQIWGPNLASAVNSGAVPGSRVDNMATRVLAAWIKMGQNDGTYPAVNFDSFVPSNSKKMSVQADHAAHIRQVGSASSVLVKNSGSALPLSRAKYAKIAIIGEDAAGPKNLNGCADHGCIDGTIAQGWGSGTTNFPYIVAPDAAIRAKASSLGISVVSSTSNDKTAGANAASSADIAVVFVFANSGEEYITVENNKGDRNNLDLWHDGNGLINAVSAVKKTVVVIHSPGPVNMPWLNNPNVVAVIYALMPGQETGNAITDVLFGDVNPSGRLPFTVGASRSDYAADVVYQDRPTIVYNEGILIDYRWFEATKRTPLLAFGHGLSYTTFSYANLRLNKTGTAWRPAFAVAVDVTNTGPVAGNEVVQLYLRLPTETCQPQGRCFLRPGETATVTFTLSNADLSMYFVTSLQWDVPAGDFTSVCRSVLGGH